MSRPTILLVDDTKLFLELEKEFLKQSAVNIMTARSGRQALEAMRLTRPDIVFLDLNMPDMDGAACCAEIKGDPDLRKVPVVMVLAAGSQEPLDRCREAGCDGLLSKPIDRRLFLQAARRFVPQVDRREGRVCCRTFVVFRVAGEAFYGTSADLSTQGIYIASDAAVMSGEYVEVSFPLPDGDAVVEAVGRIAWVNSGPPPRPKPCLPEGFGVHFTSISRDFIQEIDLFMRKSSSTPSIRSENAYIITDYL